MPLLAFNNQTAVVTGASSGVGKVISLALAAQGASLCLVGRRSEVIEAVAECARANASKVVVCQADLEIDEDIRRLKDRLHSEFSSIDLLVHSAGVISIGAFESAPVEDFDRQYRVNVRAPYLLTQVLLPMLRTSRGQVVFINSLVGLSAKGNSAQYSATKHALKALADSLRQEVNQDGLRVLSVFLGRTATPLQAAVHRLEGRTYKPELLVKPEDVAGAVLHTLSLPRSVEVTDITIRHALKTA
ncbi:MAG TPA: SDR family NAD(P)-dependent oxidoreductase [Candidatus Binatia bacterium]